MPTGRPGDSPNQLTDSVSLEVCPSCGTAATTRHRQRADGIWVLLCENCRLGFVERRPRNATSVFDDTYYEKDSETGIGYVDYRGGDPARFAWAAALVRLAGVRSSLLDIGAGSGLFLDASRAAGIDGLAGVEVNPAYAEICRQKGHAVRDGDFLALDFPDEARFRAVTAWATLEHIPDLVATLEKVRALLRPDGLLFIEVPCLTFDEKRDGPWFESSLEHVHYFSERSLQAIARRVFGREFAGRIVDYPGYGSSFVGFVGTGAPTEEQRLLAQRLVTVEAKALDSLADEEVRDLLSLHEQFGNREIADLLIGALARRASSSGSWDGFWQAHLAAGLVRLRSDLPKYLEAAEFHRHRADSSAEAFTDLEALCENQQVAIDRLTLSLDTRRRERDALAESRAYRFGLLFHEAFNHWRSLLLLPVRIPWFFVPLPTKNRVKGFLARAARRWESLRALRIENPRWPLDRPLVSVVIPCFNYGGTVTTAIESVLAQTWTDLEILVVDGGSDDPATLATLRSLRLPRTTIHFREGRHLVGDNRNFGIEKAKGRYICCLDADDILRPTYLEKAVFLAETRGYDIVYPSVRCFGASEEDWLVTDVDLEACAAYNGISTVALFRRSAWEKVGGYRDHGLGSEHVPEDWDYWVRLLASGHRAKSIREQLMLYRVHERGLTATSGRTIAEHGVRVRQVNVDVLTPRNVRRVRRSARRARLVRNPLGNLLRLPRDEADHVVIAVPFLVIGGADSILLEIARSLANTGVGVSVISTLQPHPNMGDSSARFEELTSEVYHLPRFLSDPADWPGFVRYHFASRRPRTLFLAGSEFFYRMLPEIRKESPDIRIVDQLFNEFGHLENNRRHAASIDLTVVATPLLRELLLETHGERPERVRTIIHGVDVDNGFAPAAVDPTSVLAVHPELAGKRIVSFIGRFAEEKRPHAFVRIAHLLRARPDVRFLMIGDGPQFDSVRCEIREQGLEELVILLRFVTDVRPYLKLSEVLVIPSLVEGIPIVVLESLALGAPVVASRVGGIPVAITDGETGYLVEPQDVAGFADRIAWLLDHPDGRARMGESARARAREHFSLERMRKDYLDVLTTAAVAGKPLTPPQRTS